MTDAARLIQLRRGTQASAAASNPVLDDGEPGFETDTRRLKVGDGATAWNDLPYATSAPDDAPWTTYTPTVTAGAGVFGSVSATGRYRQLGKTVFVSITVTIAANGSAGAFFAVTLPVAAADTRQMLPACENAVAGYAGQGQIRSGAPAALDRALVQRFDGGYLGADGYVVTLSGSYEAA